MKILSPIADEGNRFVEKFRKISQNALNVVLIEPEIPNNTGNVGRTCVGMYTRLHLVGPLGFSINDKQLKRAGLDYWPHLDVVNYECLEDWLDVVPSKERIFFFTTKTKRTLFDFEFQEGDWLVFGKETKGLELDILQKYPTQLVNIPMPGPIRSLNLATSVAIAMYEAYRQIR